MDDSKINKSVEHLYDINNNNNTNVNVSVNKDNIWIVHCPDDFKNIYGCKNVYNIRKMTKKEIVNIINKNRTKNILLVRITALIFMTKKYLIFFLIILK